MPKYREMSNPPQEPTTTYECSECSAHVSDPRRHTLAVHPEASVAVDAEQRSGVTDDPRQSARRF